MSVHKTGFKIGLVLSACAVFACSSFRDSTQQQVLSSLRAKARDNPWNISVDSLRLVSAGSKGRVSTYMGYAYLSQQGRTEEDTLIVTVDLTVTYYEIGNAQPLLSRIYSEP